MAMAWDAAGEGALDLRFLQDAPAGKHGFIQARDGHLVAEDGTRMRFFGVNLVFAAAFPEPDQAPAVAERLARAGVNLVRVHHADTGVGKSYLDGSGGNSRKLAREHMDRFDRLFYELKQRGIYVHLDLYTLRHWQPGDGLTHPDPLPPGAKWVTYFDERLIALQEEMAEQLLQHVNPYTGLRYADDPAVAIVQIVNENSALWWDREPPAPYLADVQARWNRWLLERFGTRAALAAAWTLPTGECALGPGEDPAAGTVAITPPGVWQEAYPDPSAPVADRRYHPLRAATWRQFLAEVMQAVLRRRAAHLRRLGVRCCINGTNLPNGLVGLKVLADLDVCEHNAYWDHPLDGFRVPMRFHLQPAVRSHPAGWGAPFSRNPVAHLASGRAAGKPFVVTECYESMPNPWRAECIPFLAAYAAFQDWDGLCLFSYSHGDWTDHAGQRHLSGCFNAWNDPAMWGLVPLGALIFRRGDVTPARQRVAVACPPAYLCAPRPDWAQPFATLPFVHRVEVAFPSGEGTPTRHEPADTATASPDLAAYHQVFLPGQGLPVPPQFAADTGELEWDWQAGVLRINTPRTQAVVGFAGGRPVPLRDVTVGLADPFGVVAVSSLDGQPLAQSRRLLITAVGQAHNSQMVWDPEDPHRLLDEGQPPVLCQCLTGWVELPAGRPVQGAWALDHRGARQAPARVDLSSGRPRLVLGSGGAALYYEVAF